MRTWIFCILVGACFGYTAYVEHCTRNDVGRIAHLIVQMADICEEAEVTESVDFRCLHKRVTLLEMINSDIIMPRATSINPDIRTLDEYQTAIYLKAYDEVRSK